MSIIGRGVLVALLLGWAAAAGAAERIERQYDETFDVQPGARLDLEHGDGDVTIVAWDRDQVRIAVAYSARVGGWGAGRRTGFEVDFRQSGDTIRVVGREPSFQGVGALSTRDETYTYDIQAPPWLELRLEGDDGDVAVAGWRAPLRATTEDGDLEFTDVVADRVRLDLDDGNAVLEGVTADIHVESNDGDLRLVDCRGSRIRVSTDDGNLEMRRGRGDLELSTDDGDLVLVEMEAARVDVRTEDGDVELELTGPADVDLLVRTEDGTVELEAPATLSADVELRTRDGRIEIDLPGSGLSGSRRLVRGSVGGGQGRIRVTTGDGDIRLRAARPRQLERADGP